MKKAWPLTGGERCTLSAVERMRAPVTFAVAQMSSQEDLGRNLERARLLVGEARRRGAEVVVLPENFALMGSEEDKRVFAERLPVAPTERGAAASNAELGPIVRMLVDAAKAEAIWIIAGGMPERSDDAARPFNTSVVVDPRGEVVASYRKIHLFDVDVGDGASYRESASTSAGTAPVACSIRQLTVGLSVCYDVRFPELYRALASLGADVLTVPAAFTQATGKDHWHVLLRARAIESQAYVVAAAQWGSHPRGRRTFGKSCIIDPWGDIVAQASEGEGIAIGVVEPDRIEKVRASLPSLEHRRL